VEAVIVKIILDGSTQNGAILAPKIRVLLAGELGVSNSAHFKGWDFFSSTVYETGIESLRQALAGSDVELVHLPGHLAAAQFPLTLAWASDIGPHWYPEPFVTWPGYAVFWKQAIVWLAGERVSGD
jgi:uncharacterized membrane protein